MLSKIKFFFVRSSKISISAIATGLFALTLAFQNCASQVQFTDQSLDLSSEGGGNSGQGQLIGCSFNGVLYQEGDSVIAYQNSSPGMGQSCVSQVRRCVNGNLTGAFTYASCSTQKPAACLFNGLTVESGSSAMAYQNSTVPFGQKCVGETRLCTNGVLAGSYAYGSCTVGAAASCLFDGKTITSGQAVMAYQNSAVPYGQTCVSQARTCNNGSLSGTYTYASCAVTAPASCMFNGQTVAHGQTLKAFQNSTVPSGQTCVSENRSCSNGTLSGTYTFASCTVNAPAVCSFNGQNVASGQSVTAYQNSTVPFGQTCAAQVRTCSNGSLSGSYVFASCSVNAAAACTFNGQNIASGQAVNAYQNSTVPFGTECVAQSRLCTNGVLSGSYSFASCSVNAPAACSFNGQNIASGQSITAYQTSAVAFGQSCVSQARTCTNGSLSGSYTFASCAVDAPKSCSFNGQTIAHGQNVIAFASSTAPYGQSCSSQVRTCTDGVLSGTNLYASCAVDAPASCSFNGVTVAHGQSVKGYAAAAVEFGQSCSEQARTCNNGALSGSYAFSSCFVKAANNCTFNSQAVAHGSSVTAFAAAVVPYGESCSAQTRTCSNGVLSGSYNITSCSVTAPANCTFNGSGVLHGQSVRAYAASTVEFGQSCSEQSRTCTNGVLSGTYGFSSCVVKPGPGVCGSATTGKFETAPTANLCSQGTASAVRRGFTIKRVLIEGFWEEFQQPTNEWLWTCSGSQVANCVAKYIPPLPAGSTCTSGQAPIAPGPCSASFLRIDLKATTLVCPSGSRGSGSSYTSYTWKCADPDGRRTDNCSVVDYRPCLQGK